MIKFFQLLLLFIYFNSIYSQCPTVIIIDSQTDVDSFSINYPGCTDIFSLKIDGGGNKISNLHGLSQIQKLKELWALGFNVEVDAGDFVNVKIDSVLWTDLNPDMIFRNIDTLDIFNISSYFRQSNDSLNQYNHIKHIRKIFWVNGNIEYAGFNGYTADEDVFVRSRVNTKSSDLSILFPSNVSRIGRLEISESDKLYISDLKNLKSVSESIRFRLVNGGDLSELKNLDIARVVIENQETDFDFGGAFDNVEELDELVFRRNTHLPPLESLFPKLQSINDLLILSLCDVDLDLNFFKDFEVITRTGEAVLAPTNLGLLIIDNNNLKNCTNDFICRSLQSTIVDISGNNSGCSASDILASCPSSVEEEGRDYLKTYPNPTNGVLRWNIEGVDYVEMRGTDGRLLQTSYNSNYIDLSDHPKGMYIIRMYSKDKQLLLTDKIIKI